MQHIRSIEECTAVRPTAVTLGKFDGVHRGHRILLSRIHEIARREGLLSAVFTFQISPQIQMGERENGLLLTNDERAAYLRERDVDLLAECPFTDEIRNMEAEQFVQTILVDRLQAKAIVVGTDFRFGKGRAGTPEFLRACGRKLGFSVEIIEKEKDVETGRDISSTYIRELLTQGRIEKAAELLGYPYFVTGRIVHGRHLGRKLGFPTINQIPDPEKLLPPHGVYMSRTQVGGKTYQGITNIGVKPTVNGEALGLETYLFDCSLDLYEQDARVELLCFHRPEQNFGSVDALKEQVLADIREADLFFGSR